MHPPRVPARHLLGRVPGLGRADAGAARLPTADRLRTAALPGAGRSDRRRPRDVAVANAADAAERRRHPGARQRGPVPLLQQSGRSGVEQRGKHRFVHESSGWWHRPLPIERPLTRVSSLVSEEASRRGLEVVEPMLHRSSRFEMLQ